jgi:N-acetylglucosaminyldiphosphoundecaprenol N-acetyl-beta-D-mannosaminyltransferase
MTTMTAHDLGYTPARPLRCNVLGVGISAVNQSSALEMISNWIATRQRQYVCITGVHGVMESQRDPALKTIHNRAGLVTPDGVPMVWANWFAGHTGVRRVYGPDLMLNICATGVERGWRHYFYGGGPGVAQTLAQALTRRFPGLIVAGLYTPPFRPLTVAEDAQVVEQINATRADIVWVGLSTPKQEYWMSAHLGRLEAPVMVGVGAAFDFNAGLKKQAPRWLRNCGFEWAFRLCTEPRRLWKRYLINNPLFLVQLALQALRLKDFSESAPGQPPGTARVAKR